MPHPSHDPSIEYEPHLHAGAHEVDPAEAEAQRLLAHETAQATIDEVVQHTVWDEPTLSDALAGPARGPRLTYAQWLDWRIATTSVARTWYVTLAIVLAAGPWGVLGALFENMAAGTWGLIAVVVIAPVVEETMKVAIALWVIEKRPYLFRRPLQILLCALAGGLAFAFIENVMYLYVTIPASVKAEKEELVGKEEPVRSKDIQPAAKAATIDLATWRWTICTGLHATCSFLAGLGLVRMWSLAFRHRTRPKIAHAAPMIVAAMIGHGLYNGIVTIAELAGWLPF
jgi:RsiW-degrading membrane proteinase PrsW (M82 family)